VNHFLPIVEVLTVVEEVGVTVDVVSDGAVVTNTTGS